MFDCGSFIAKYLLCGFNFLLFVVGGVIMGIGIWLVCDLDSFLGLTKILETEGLNIGNILQPKFILIAAYIVIAIGGTLFLISFFGYCGALTESQCMLTTYGLILLLILILEIALGASTILLKSKLENVTKDLLRETLDEYVPIDENTDRSNISATTAAWDSVQTTMHCCGINSYEDFKDNKYLVEKDRKIPGSCCKGIRDNELQPTQIEKCVKNPNDSNAYLNGCFDSILNILKKQLNIVIAIAISVIGIEILAIFLAFCLAKSANRQVIR